MQEQNNKTLSYSQQRKVFFEKVKSLKEILLDAANHSANNQSINNWLDNSIISVSDDNKYYSLTYFYDSYSLIKDVSQPPSIKQLVYILACMLAEKKFKTKDLTCDKLLESLELGAISYSLIKGSKFETTKISLSTNEQNFLNFQIQDIILKEMLEKLQNKVDNPQLLYNKMYKELATKNNEIQNTLNEYQTKADNLADFIAKQQSNLNFVGLGNAFKQLTDGKEKNKKAIIWGLGILFLLLIAIPITIAVILAKQEAPNFYICIPATTIEILFLYAFRLLYQQYLFVKSELLQISLRYNLCAFIESYMEFKKDNKDNTVDLFEQLIFSNIISDEKKVPATVDGLDGIAKIIETLKGK